MTGTSLGQLAQGIRVEVPVPVASDIEVSFVMPCLNEAETLEGCIRAANACIAQNQLRGEVIIGDNGSTDGSQDIARRLGARVVDVPRKGYGNALLGGIRAARGRFVIMGDSDMSYDFGDAMKFVSRLRSGDELVMGNRFDAAGGGGVQPGAMPLKNRYLGNPVLTWIGRVLFRCPARDFHCGLRGMRKEAFERMDVRSPGMEFASEMVIKATFKGMRISEVPVKLHPDGRSRPPHLKPWRDGWRHLRFMICHSPRWALLIPGIVLLTAGLLGGAAVAAGDVRVLGVNLGVHTLVAAALAVILGHQWVMAGMVMRVFGLRTEIGRPGAWAERIAGWVNFERGLIAGAALTLAGLAPMLWVVWRWAQGGYGTLEPRRTLRPMLVGATILVLGVQTALAAVIGAMFRMRRDADVA